MVNYAGVDWLTMVSRDNKVGEHWYRLFRDYRKEVIKDELRVKTWNNGLYAGQSIGHLRWGYSNNLGYIFIASSSLAEQCYQRFKPAKHKVTRIDLCMDFRLPYATPIAQNIFEEFRNAEKRGRIQKKLYQGPLGGDTLYIGSRQSRQCGRLYDKGIEQGTDEAGCYWRMEVEYKKPLAGQIVAVLSECDPKEREMIIADTVWDWFATRGVVAIEQPFAIDPIDVQSRQVISTREKKLIWLAKQVKPTVQDLCTAGWSREVYQALGLTVEDWEIKQNVTI